MQDHRQIERNLTYYRAIRICCDRYSALNTGDEELNIFIKKLRDACDAREPLFKLNRWLGYIQGVLIIRGHTTVTAERNFTRPLFRPLDYP